MKYLSLLIISLLLSCGASKRLKENTSKEIAIIESQNKTQKEITPTDSIKKTEVTLLKKVDSIAIDKEKSSLVEVVFDHSIWNALLQKHVSDLGHVNYKGFKRDLSQFNTYLNALSNNPAQDSWSKENKLAYWINVYNAYTIKLILINYPVKSIKDIHNPWNHRFIKIGEKWFALNDIEHRIIRKMNEARIHFALVCAAVSCPILYNKAFTAINLEADLNLLTRKFLNDPSKNNFSKKRIVLSRIFKWYGSDFKKHGTLIDFFNLYVDVSIDPDAKKKYKEYNWNLNE